MNKMPFNESSNLDDDMLSEYHFDYQKAKPNRFANRNDKKMIVVVLDEDVAQVGYRAKAKFKGVKDKV